jgi:hypothetical protein
MIIWTLALLLFGALGYLGFALGAIRVSFTFLGLIVGSLLAMPVGRHLKSVLESVGLKNPFLVWLVGPLVVLLVVLVIFKICGFAVHRKVDVHFKYKAGDLRMALWNRLNARLGICMGMANATVYVILISLVIYVMSYSTAQTMTSDQAGWPVKMLNIAGKNLESSGMAKVAAAIDPMPVSYYDAADLVGLIYHNDLLEARLSHYPGLLSLGERAEFQAIGDDKAFVELRQRQPPFMEIVNNDKVQSILNNKDLLLQIWATIEPNLKDLQNYLLTGESEKYGQEKILGRWVFNSTRAIAMLRQTRPNIGSIEMQRLRLITSLVFAKTTMVVTPEPDKQIFIKNIGKISMVPVAQGAPRPGVPAGPRPSVPQVTSTENFQGTWEGDGSKYQLKLQDHGTFEAVVENDRITITGYQFPMVFDKEY